MSKQTFNNQASSPGTPAAGKLNQWGSTANKRFWFTDENGVSAPIGIPYTTYYVDDYGVTPANSAATNVTNLNTLLQTTAPDKSRIMFGSGTYQFNAGLTSLTKDFAFMGVRGMTTIAITADMGASTPFLNLSNTGYYTSLRDLNFVNFASQTTNMVIAGRNNVNVEILDCFFTGASNWVDVITFSGTNSGNGAILKNVYIANFSGKAINVVSPLDTMYIKDLEIIGTGLAGSVGFYCSDGGAALLTDCQIISADVNVKLDPANGKTVSAIFAVNCFFDQGKTNCMLITGAGTGTVARCHFVGCWFTISGTSSSGGAGSNTKCIQITTAGTGIHAGLQFQDCEIMNATTGSTGTLEGILATSVQDFTVMGCQFAGWTNDIQITPASAGTCAPTIIGNTFATWGLVATSTNGIILNAGAVVYGTINIQTNSFGGKSGTANILDNSTQTAPTEKVIRNNVGTGKDLYAARTTASQTVGTTVMTNVTGLSFPIAQPSLVYEFEANLPGVSQATATTSTAVGITVAVPAGATINYNVFGSQNATGIKNSYVTATATSSAQAFAYLTTSGVTGGLRIAGVVIAGTATGNVQVMVNAVGTASTAANTATIQQGSWIRADKVV